MPARTASRAISSRWWTTGRRRTASRPRQRDTVDIGNGDVLIAAITSCTNTSNPGVLLAAGLLAKKAVEKRPHREAAHQDVARTGLARGHRLPDPGGAAALSRQARLLAVAAYGCTTCIGNAGDLAPEINDAITGNDLVVRGRAVGQSQFRGAHPSEPQGELPRRRRRSSSRMRSPAPCCKDLADRAARHRAQNGPVYLQRHLADVARDRGGDELRQATRPSYRAPLRRPRQRESDVERHRGHRPDRSTTGRNRRTSPSRRFSTASR